MYVIYALIDPRTNQARYVGVTDDVYARFAQHLRCDGSNPMKDTWIQELKAANTMVMMQTLQVVADQGQAQKREAYWMRHYYDLGMQLTNQSMPILHDQVIIVHQQNQKPRLKALMTPDEQRAYILSLLNQGLPRKRILAKVDGYIHPDTANGIINDSIPLRPVQEEAITTEECNGSLMLASPAKTLSHVSGEIKKASDVGNETRTIIRRSFSRGLRAGDIAYSVGLTGRKYGIFQEVCLEMGIDPKDPPKAAQEEAR
jgi:predicted GIY-YIG superfamily endonuclease